MSIDYHFVQAVDTLSLRGNKLFGDPGSYGESHCPPRPSLLSGAFRSVLFSRAGLDYVLNSPLQVSAVFPAIRNAAGKVQALLPLPADLVVVNDGDTILRQRPMRLPDVIQHSQDARLPMMPVLRQGKAAKPESGWLLNAQGIRAYLDGKVLQKEHLSKQDRHWLSETRVGIGLNATSRTADDGKLFSIEHTVQKQAEHADTSGNTSGLLVGITGQDEKLPDKGLLRLGGDGRAACYQKVNGPDINLPKLEQRFKLVLLTPGLFTSGWLPDGVTESNGHYWLNIEGLRARLACTSLNRAEVISGWDIANKRPKVAERVVPAGSLYWFDQMQGDISALDKLATEGLWQQNDDNNNQARRIEGYNRILLAKW